MYKVVNIEGKNIPMKSTGLTARLYSRYFGKDFFSSFLTLRGLKDGKQVDTSIFEEIAWTLAKTANPKIPDIDEWLDGFESPFSIYKKMGEIIRVIDKSFNNSVNPKKKTKKTRK